MNLPYLPSIEECREIIDKTDAFYCTETEVQGFKVQMYDYRLASITDFVEHKAFELRGLTFVQDSNGIWHRNILMNKFFNVGQCKGWLEPDLKDKKIVRVQDKLDGSVISFVRFPDGVIRAKSKMSFTSEQAQMAQDILDNNTDIQSFIKKCFDDEVTPVFELVSPSNQIVLEYPKTELVLLQIRDKQGNYKTENYLKGTEEYNIKVSEFLPNYALHELLHKKEVLQDIEGWVVTFEDGQMAKIKTDWYLRLHGLIGPDAFRENLLIPIILDDTVDDLLSNLPEDSLKRQEVQDLMHVVQSHYNHLVQEYILLREVYFNEYNQDRKSFAMQYSPKGKTPHDMFGYIMKSLNSDEVEKNAEKAAKEYILNRCSSLSAAKQYMNSLNNKG
jgi:RNA ligase